MTPPGSPALAPMSRVGYEMNVAQKKITRVRKVHQT
jgi:hypothetical protein